MALACWTPRKNSGPALLALMPQAERLDPGSGDQLQPPGFHMIRLPWGEEIREIDLPLPDGLRLPPGIVDSARNTINAMRLDDFQPGCAENPVLQKHFAAVQALALGEDCPEETVDVLQPDGQALADKAPLL